MKRRMQYALGGLVVVGLGIGLAAARGGRSNNESIGISPSAMEGARRRLGVALGATCHEDPRCVACSPGAACPCPNPAEAAVTYACEGADRQPSCAMRCISSSLCGVGDKL